MKITKKDWNKYIQLLSGANKTASKKMQAWVNSHGYDDMEALIDYAYSLTTAYGEAAASIACDMYDAVAEAQKVSIRIAEPAETQTFNYVKKAVEGAYNRAPSTVPSVVGEMVKRTGAETTLKNALRDGAYFAWIPNGDTCAFCITLASRGWQRASKNSIKNGHAEHIHKNCDCEYAISFNGPGNVEDYDPDKYLKMYHDAEGSTPVAKINAMRREQYAKNPEKYLAPKRERYAKQTERVLQTQLGFVYNDSPEFIPKNTTIVKPEKIAGPGTKKELRDVDRLVAVYGGTKKDWNKMVGKVESDKFTFDIHWYERDGVIYEPKIKSLKEKK